jgi:Tfp pilus assembly protein PilX
MHASHRSTSRNSQRGIVLIVALVMMALIAISTAMVMKGALFQDKISANQRARGLAFNAAEMALRYCEARVTANTISAAQSSMPVTQVAAFGRQPAWQNIDNWNSDTFRTIVPNTFAFDGSNATFSRAPECMIQRLNLPDTTAGGGPAGATAAAPEAYIVTARGFSPDYAEQNNVPTSGSVIWLQSTIQIRLE